MNVNMFQNTITQENLTKLKSRGFTILGPDYGRLASGKFGLGRLIEIEEIIGTIRQILGKGGDLAGKRIVVTAGGTKEPVDPIRYIGNHSSGKMGYAIAEAARDRGAATTLITTSFLPSPAGISIIRVETSADMREEVAKVTPKADVLIMAAAVADYKPKTTTKSKIKRKDSSLILNLMRTPDILGEVRGNLIKVGFAAETEKLIEHARQKLDKKQLDLIVANNVTTPDSGFGRDTIKVVLISRDSKTESLPLLAKREVADIILDRVIRIANW
jgi:phosphopantothenoylcysteine decarboxylase/phosphopantothenate--cysteine ligase